MAKYIVSINNDKLPAEVLGILVEAGCTIEKVSAEVVNAAENNGEDTINDLTSANVLLSRSVNTLSELAGSDALTSLASVNIDLKVTAKLARDEMMKHNYDKCYDYIVDFEQNMNRSVKESYNPTAYKKARTVISDALTALSMIKCMNK